MEEEERAEQQAGKQGVRIQQPGESPEVAVRAYLKPAEQIPEGHAEQQRRQEAGNRRRPLPEGFPGGGLHFAPEFQRHAPGYQREKDKGQGGIEPAEKPGVNGRESRERGPAGGHQPDLVAVPEGPDGSENAPAFLFSVRRQPAREADAQVEPVQREVAGPQHRPEHEPNFSVIHIYPYSFNPGKASHGTGLAKPSLSLPVA